METLLSWSAVKVWVVMTIVLAIIGCAVHKVFILKEHEELSEEDIKGILYWAAFWPIVIPIGATWLSAYLPYLLIVHILQAVKKAFFDNGCKK